MDIYERIEAMDPATFESRAAMILAGLGFTKKQMEKQTKDLSGGWRMRVALAKVQCSFGCQKFEAKEFRSGPYMLIPFLFFPLFLF
jgi:ABC-type hemin transport system ATPase subunit